MLVVAAERSQISPTAASTTTIWSRPEGNGLGEQVESPSFPDNQLGQEIDVINSVKLGVIDLMVSGSSISANLVPLVGTFDLGYLFTSFPQQTKAFDAGAAKPIEEALLKGANIRIISWAYNFGSRSVLAKKPVKGPEDLAGLKIRTLPNPVITECLRLMGRPRRRWRSVRSTRRCRPACSTGSSTTRRQSSPASSTRPPSTTR
jgi:TRAP-type C4-dicarboxylate transport system, periplasmic component